MGRAGSRRQILQDHPSTPVSCCEKKHGVWRQEGRGRPSGAGVGVGQGRSPGEVRFGIWVDRKGEVIRRKGEVIRSKGIG